MSLRNRNGLAVLLRVALLFCSAFVLEEIIINYSSGDVLRGMLYYYYPSNLLMILVTLIYLGFGVRTRITGGTRIPRAMQLIRFIVAVSATFTLLHHWILFFATLGEYRQALLIPFLIYTLIPLLFITDFLAFDRGEPMKKADVWLAGLLPLVYLFYTLFYTALDSGTFEINGHPYLFFFTDLNTLGYFQPELDLFIVWPILILFGATIGIGFLYRFIQLKTIKEP